MTTQVNSNSTVKKLVTHQAKRKYLAHCVKIDPEQAFVPRTTVNYIPALVYIVMFTFIPLY